MESRKSVTHLIYTARLAFTDANYYETT